MFSSKSFIISDLTFSSLVWVYFLHGMKTYCNLILLHVVSNRNFSNCIIHLCLFILYLLYVLGNCINCVNCFLHYPFYFQVFRTSLLSLSEFCFRQMAYFLSVFIWSCEFIPCSFICAVVSCILIFFSYFALLEVLVTQTLGL